MTELEKVEAVYKILSVLPRYANAKDTLKGSGVYFFFEPGEYRADGQTPRVVRVGTHAVSDGSQTTLWNRLSQHRGRLAGAHAGGGNHRGSIFRLHVGTALLGLGRGDAAAATQWGTSHRPTDMEALEAEYQLEALVSEYIRAMPFLWLEVDDPPSKASHRKVIEANVIGLLSNWGRPTIDPPSTGWLGHQADREAVRRSGLWNVDHVTETYDPVFLQLMEGYIV